MYSEEIRVSCEVQTEFLCIQKKFVFTVRYELIFMYSEEIHVYCEVRIYFYVFRRNSCFL
jgi:hypothetical protein